METKPIRDLIEEVQGGECPPGRLAEIAVELSSWSATLGESLKDILVFKADVWLEIRKTTTSDKMTDKLWDATLKGKEEMTLRSQLTYITKIVSNIKLLLRTKENESFGRY